MMSDKVHPHLEELKRDFDEFIYLKYNHDVSLAVAEGIYPNGLTHFMRFGFKEGRIYKDRQSHFLKDYEALILKKINEHPNNIDLAMVQSVGCKSIDEFLSLGQYQVNILKNLGFENDMSVYDLGCGCGRTSQALIKCGWKGKYVGADVMSVLIDYAKEKSSSHHFFVHRDLSIKAEDHSLDWVMAWSVFTHLTDEEIYIYLRDILRALKSDGKFVFSFLEHERSDHEDLFLERVRERGDQYHSDHLDNFLHREFIKIWAKRIGFNSKVHFLLPQKAKMLGQSVAVLSKP